MQRTGLDLVTSQDKKFPDLASARFQIHSVFKNFYSSKSCGSVWRIHRIRVNGSRIRKETVADSKLSGYVWTRPEILRQYFMESAGVRYLRTSCWRIRNRKSKYSERAWEWGFQYKKRVRSTFNVELCLLYTEIILAAFSFQIFPNSENCRYTHTRREMTTKWKY